MGIFCVTARREEGGAVEKLKVWVDEQYAGGRTTALSNEELEEKIAELSGGVLKPRH